MVRKVMGALSQSVGCEILHCNAVDGWRDFKNAYCRMRNITL